MISPSTILDATAHRPWPLPPGPWIMEQGWYKLLFAHWEVSSSTLRTLVPGELELDSYHGTAWVSITPFHLTVRPRGAGLLGHLWTFPELNLRTYVVHQDKPGIFFFSLDAASLLAVAGARTFYRLPYFHARMQSTSTGHQVHYTSRRFHSTAEFEARYEPVSEPYHAQPGTLNHWLAERYCLYVVNGGRVSRGDIHHGPWALQHAAAEIRTNTLPAQAGLSLAPTPDLLQFSAAEEVLIWPLRQA